MLRHPVTLWEKCYVCVCLVTQSCPTLCNPMDYSLPDSSVHGDSPGKNTEVGQSVQFSRTVVSDSLSPMDCSTPGFPVHHQLPELTQTQVHRVGDAWSGYPILSPGDLSDPEIKPRSPALQADSLQSEPPGKPKYCLVFKYWFFKTWYKFCMYPSCQM